MVKQKDRKLNFFYRVDTLDKPQTCRGFLYLRVFIPYTGHEGYHFSIYTKGSGRISYQSVYLKHEQKFGISAFKIRLQIQYLISVFRNYICLLVSLFGNKNITRKETSS